MNQVDSDTVRLQRALSTSREMRAKIDELEREKTEPIAIVGMACRFPFAPTPAAYWELLRNGVNAIGEVPKDRWDIEEYYDSDPQVRGKMYARHGGFLQNLDLFDAQFFGISPREATSLDPQQRLLLEVSWEALENAGVNPQQLEGSPTGVFVGICEGEYARRLRQEGTDDIDMDALTGNASSVASARLSYFLGLQGPNLAVDTACSSSLVAIHLAVASLRRGECSLALAGGVNVILAPDVSIAFCRARALAFDGRCKAFDAAADGYVRGEGSGIVVLKPLSAALQDRDSILAVIRGSAINQDGRKNGLTAPNGLAQQAVIRQALATSGVAPAEISYVEAHGTGTQLGDSIEIQALGAVFGRRDLPLFVGAVKTNIGHLEAASGVAGVIKAVLALQYREIPPSLHFHHPNLHIPWNEWSIKVPIEHTPWPAGRRFAGVSSFGFSGTNAHLVLEQAPDNLDPTPESDRSSHLLTLSAMTTEALFDLASSYATYLTANPTLNLGDIGFTTQTGRSHFPHRLSVVAESVTECAATLSAYAAGKSSPSAIAGQIGAKPRIAFLFPGQGSQYVGMGRKLFYTHSAFRRNIERCDAILKAGGYLERSLIEILYPACDVCGSRLIDPSYHAQPAIFAIEYALAELWQSWGIRPDILLGHSTGEYVAACMAGVFSLEDGLRLVAERARLLASGPAGCTTVAVFADLQRVTEIIAPFSDDVSISGMNAPRETLIAGHGEAIDAALIRLRENKVDSRKLKIPHAAHSAMVEPILDAFEAFAQKATYHRPNIPLVSNVTGQLIERLDAAYWRTHMRSPVNFMKGMKQLAEYDCNVMLEIGSQPILQLLGRQNWWGPKAHWLTSLWAIKDDWKQLLQSLGELYVQGAEINWTSFDQPYVRRKTVLPNYAFQRQRYWVNERNQPKVAENASQASSTLERIYLQLENITQQLASLRRETP
jgi:acyl transferase domain-containing protein